MSKKRAKKLAEDAAEEAAKTAKKTAKKTGAKVLTSTYKKVLPVLSILFLANDIQAKGPVGGIANTLLDSTPGVSHLKDLIEPFTGDLISDLGSTGPIGFDKIVNAVDSWNRQMYGNAAMDKTHQDFRKGLHEVQRGVEYVPRQLFGDAAVNNYQNGWRTIESWFR